MSCMLLYVFDTFHILLSGDSLRDLCNLYMYICVYIRHKQLDTRTYTHIDTQNLKQLYRHNWTNVLLVK